MKEFKEKNVKIFTNNVEQAAIDQILRLAETKMFGDGPIRIMPDCHAGAGCVIGFTAPLAGKICPNIVGVDLNCGMLCVPLGKVYIDLAEFDSIVKSVVPAGKNVQEEPSEIARDLIDRLICKDKLKNVEWLERSLGTLGGGNHFIELEEAQDGKKFLTIHTGSRNLGKQVAEIYQKIAEENIRRGDVENIIATLKEQGREREITNAIKEYKKARPSIPKDLAYLEGKDLQNYLHDITVCREFADRNRAKIAAQILSKLSDPISAFLYVLGRGFTTLHNYIGEDKIVRKGAISAKRGESVLIPLNMRDGCILGVGKGNTDWNNSAPHGAGRVMSRAQARKDISIEDFKKTMDGVYSSTVSMETIDEAPFAYKPSEEIIELVKETVDIVEIIKPIYNFKAAE